MDLSGSSVLIVAAILSGMVHAFDIDHLVTVATFSSTGGSRKNSIRFCAHWATGHGATILALAVLVYITGVNLPTRFFEFAESLVGVVLIALGVWVWRSIYQRQFSAKGANIPPPNLRRKPFAIGTLHGLAGSAPVLLAFLVDVHKPLVGLGLILLFVAGVFLSMIGVGVLLGSVFRRVFDSGSRVLLAVRGTLASLSILVGGALIYAHF